MNPLSEIKAFVQVDDRTGTSGMPKPEDFARIAAAGYRTVINLALPTSDNAMANEGELVTRNGMNYVQIPIAFDAPKTSDFETFSRIMDAVEGQKVFVHCAANMRVSAFLFLYRLTRGQSSRERAEQDLFRIWKPDRVWRSFINEHLPSGEPPFPE